MELCLNFQNLHNYVYNRVEFIYVSLEMSLETYMLF